MTYRRSTYRRRGGSYRRPKKQLMWCRDALNATIPITQTTGAVVDLLWLLRHPPVAGALLEDGLRGQRAAPDTAQINTKDYTGSVIKRIRLQYAVSSSTTQPNAGDGIYVGIGVAPGTDPQGAAINLTDMQTNPRTEVGANVADWLYWHRKPFWNPINTAMLTATGTFDFAINHEVIDTRCARKIEDWGDTLRLNVVPSMTSSLTFDLGCVWSVLLALP